MSAAVMGAIVSMVCYIFGWVMCRRHIDRRDGITIKKGDRVFTRMYWTDERGNVMKCRHFIAAEIDRCYDEKGPVSGTRFIQLVGDEPGDGPTQKELGVRRED